MTIKNLLVLFAVAVATAVAPMAEAGIWYPTNHGNGADAEVRESNASQNRGDSTEIASRIKNAAPSLAGNDGSDRNSLIYTKFDITGLELPADGKTAFRMTYRNTNLSGNRLFDTVTPNVDNRAAMAVYALKTTAATWAEDTITYANAPGLVFPGDLNIGTRELTDDLVFLGTVTFPQVASLSNGVGGQNRLPVGGVLKFESENLDDFVGQAIIDGATEVTLVTGTFHDGNIGIESWLNFNYLFNPKEQTTLNDDPSWDSDVEDDMNALGSPHSGADNSTGRYSPSLLLRVPEPTSLSLISLVAAGFVARRRRS
ncbi:hypothetical protein Mal64_14380 [Pseudobythopirellula maris]|uniref:Ice-binding protein C-terminal domain-containing protein n=1 Tax=Pseudobythopirellula maris TaxID=2527991 RepID=A0A5C5ZUF8_9BACT|nr:PEP-CTERM sorting domain-containing protein [Pseudobythopirellula maris]TWT91039.1 hypothetical protein Mal64_14380 [Pseudobythopirellula maris]